MGAYTQPSVPFVANDLQPALKAIIGPQYCAPNYPVDLAIARKILAITDGNFTVTDVNGNIMFKVKGALLKPS
ncbi:hypothetical protein L484_021992 [Morus notabilis]|uniref:Uncharacterized protein n=1 Tax=Morus notabilis TaxID=981085 RepID=W9R941_9ROSA|nr:hypothetical protein L484_021992 [Morus notabilis]